MVEGILEGHSPEPKEGPSTRGKISLQDHAAPQHGQSCADPGWPGPQSQEGEAWFMGPNGEMLGNGGPRMWRGTDVPEISLWGVSVRDPGKE